MPGTSTNGENVFLRTFNDGLSFPATHPGNGCEAVNALKCKILSSNIDNTFVGSSDQNGFFLDSDKFFEI